MSNFISRKLPALLLASSLIWTQSLAAQSSSNRPGRLAAENLKSGEVTLRAFAPVAKAARESVVKIEVDGKPAALGAIVAPEGLVVTKASEVETGELTCRLASGRQVKAEVVAVDRDNDVALLKLEADGLRPIDWSLEENSVGQWAVTPGLESVPEAVGIVSVPIRRIQHQQALIGVRLASGSAARVEGLMEGLGAEKAGLQPGDLILAVNETPVEGREKLVETLRAFREGQTVRLRIQRGEEEVEASVEMMVPAADESAQPLSRQERMNRMGGEISRRAQGFELAIQHDSALQPWQCGGPLVNLDGKAIGLNIARAGRVASYALPAQLVQQVIENLKARTQMIVKHEEAEVEELAPAPEM